MAAGTLPETWFPVTPPPNGHLEHAPSKEIGILATPVQSEGKEDSGKEKVELKKERKKRGHRGRIFLDATFERTPKKRTPKPKTPKPKTPKPKTPKPKTPKPAKPDRVVPLEPKKKNTKRKFDNSIILIPEEDLSVVTVVEDLSVVTVVNNETPLITEISYRRGNLNEPTSSKRSKLNIPAKRVLDLNLDCQLEDENSSDLVPQLCAPESSSRGNSLLNMCRGDSLQLRCRCCLCRIGKVKPQFPKEHKRLRTVLRIANARRQRLLPTTSKISIEAIKRFFNCTMLLTQTPTPGVKRRKARKNRYLTDTIQAQQASPLLQQSIVPGLDHSVVGENIKVVDQQASLVNTMKEKTTKVKKEKVTKIKKEKVTKVKKEKVTRVKTGESGALVTKERKKKKKKLTWDERSPMEDMVDYITASFQGSLVIPSLYRIHMDTHLEAIVDEESKQVCKLLKDKEDDGYDPTKEADEAKQRWWDEQRKKLCEKAFLFIMVMRQFLGNRAFSPWKGSVADSVVGVYLTQNVSDNLSSSAFMSMVARYPAKPPREDAQLCIEYKTSSRNQQDETEAEIRTSQESVASSSLLAQHTDSPDSSAPKQKIEEGKGKGDVNINWDDLRTAYSRHSHGGKRSPDRADSVDWNAVRKADVHEVAKVIEQRGQHNILAAKIKSFLDRVVKDHGSVDLEWLREVPPLKAKEYLLSIHGIGLKSVECLRLLTLHHHAFPVDVNVGRISVRLGWVPLQPLPNSVQFHLLSNYPSMDQIQEYLWPRLCHMSQTTLYELHYLMITFGKVFCTKVNPHCGACPLREDCKYYKSKRESSIPSLAWLKHEDAKKDLKKARNPFKDGKPSSLAIVPIIQRFPVLSFLDRNSEPIIEEPSSPEPQPPPDQEIDIEDLFLVDEDDPDDIPFIDLTTQKLPNDIEEVHDTSGAIVTLSPKLASDANPKLKSIARMRTEHQVYEVPDSHPLLQGLPRREVDDKCPYLLAIWPQEGADGSCGQEKNQTVPGTLLIPVRTATRGSFPLNGTYFQVNEVFVDDETSKRPIDVPTSLIWYLAKKTVYCGTSTTSILKGLTMEHIRHCFVEGYICTRAFNRDTRQPKLLPSIFHERPTSTPKKKKPEEDKA